MPLNGSNDLNVLTLFILSLCLCARRTPSPCGKTVRRFASFCEKIEWVASFSLVTVLSLAQSSKHAPLCFASRSAVSAASGTVFSCPAAYLSYFSINALREAFRASLDDSVFSQVVSAAFIDLLLLRAVFFTVYNKIQYLQQHLQHCRI